MASRLRLAVFVVASLLAALTITDAGAADKVRTRAWAHPGFGRLVFDWPAPVTFKAAISGQKLVIIFARPLETDLSRVDRYLGAYVRKGAGKLVGGTLTLPLTGAFRVSSRSSGNTVVVDIKPQDGKTAEAGQAAPKAGPKAGTKKSPPPAQGSGPPVRVRIGEHAGYTRVVFDWTGDVRYRVERQGAAVTVEFDRPNAVAVASLARRLPARLTAAKANVSGGKSLVTLGIAAEARLRHFRSGTKVVLDVLDKQPGAASPQKAPKVTAAKQADAAPPKPQIAAAKQAKAA